MIKLFIKQSVIVKDPGSQIMDYTYQNALPTF